MRTSALAPLVKGRDLLAIGLAPSPRFKEIIDEVYALQIEGKIQSKEQALRYIQKYAH